MVTLPNTSEGISKLESELLVKELKERLSSTGFTHVALTHTIYGRPKPEDRAAVAIPDALLSAPPSSSSSFFVEQPQAIDPTTTTHNNNAKKRKRTESSPGGGARNRSRREFTVLRRLHVVLEQQSDAFLYVSNGPHEDLLNGYDVVSLAPTNDLAFKAACGSASAADVVTLDYYTGHGLGLPYRIRSAEVRALTDRGAALEIPVAPALLHLRHRKALVNACSELSGAALGIRPRVLLSSGPRVLEGRDAGALALRMPGDLTNLCRTVLGLGETASAAAVGAAPMSVVERGRDRRSGRTRRRGNTTGNPRVSVRLYGIRKTDLEEPDDDNNDEDDEDDDEEPRMTGAERPNEPERELSEKERGGSPDNDEDSNDGFIAL